MAKFCTNCGSKLEENAFFCTNCGKKIDDSGIPNNGKPQGLRGRIREQENHFNQTKDGIRSRLKEKSEQAKANSLKRQSMKGNIPRLGGIAEYRSDSIVIRKTEEVIPISEISNFSLHQSSQSLWSDVKVDFDYNGKHYRTQVAGTEKGKLQTIEKKISAIEMSRFSNSIAGSENNDTDSKSKAERIREIKELLDEGIIDEEEFKKLKSEIIDE
ncbi:MAG: zinc-ribbon domain-containing protein [Methanobrevibacter sp.]|uniref:zinc-ribbon domain-containing protein n=1 Tax=Methanobrevibacter sp. TaxID=66852 RepID=UPI0025E1EECD|nr:zinc-ribbon domain-containing protein [Methanobrevibacter sp.]MBQ6099396.1 zinc-ribbon domain-containing protein [Methanobrevibacter sp.]